MEFTVFLVLGLGLQRRGFAVAGLGSVRLQSGDGDGTTGTTNSNNGSNPKPLNPKP